MREPCSLRRSGAIDPRDLSKVEIDPFLPSAAIRIASMAVSSLAAVISVSSTFCRRVRSVIRVQSTAQVRRAYRRGASEGMRAPKAHAAIAALALSTIA